MALRGERSHFGSRIHTDPTLGSYLEMETLTTWSSNSLRRRSSASIRSELPGKCSAQQDLPLWTQTTLQKVWRTDGAAPPGTDPATVSGEHMRPLVYPGNTGHMLRVNHTLTGFAGSGLQRAVKIPFARTISFLRVPRLLKTYSNKDRAGRNRKEKTFPFGFSTFSWLFPPPQSTYIFSIYHIQNMGISPLSPPKKKPQIFWKHRSVPWAKKSFGKRKKTFSPQTLIGFVHKTQPYEKAPFLTTTKKAEISTSFISKWRSKACGTGSKSGTPSQHH